jgi:hypothetical protein
MVASIPDMSTRFKVWNSELMEMEPEETLRAEESENLSVVIMEKDVERRIARLESAHQAVLRFLERLVARVEKLEKIGGNTDHDA